MSVVNKMLSDLETRKQQASAQADYVPPASDKWRGVRIALIILVLVAVAAAIYWQMTRTIKYTPAPAEGSETMSSVGVGEAAPGAGGRSASPDGITPVSPAATSEARRSTTPEVRANENISADTPAVAEASIEQPLFTEVEGQLEGDDDSALADVTAIAGDDEANSTTQAMAQTNDDTLSSTSDTPVDMAATHDAPEEAEPRLIIAPSSSRSGSDVSSLKQEARLALNANDNDRAITLLGQILKQEPGNVAVRKQLAALLFGAGLIPQAQTLLTDGIDISPENLELRVMLARLFMQQSANDRGYQVLAPLSVDVFMHSDYISLRASLAEKSGQFEAARRDYQQLVTAFPDNATWWLGLAVVLERLEQYSASRQAYRRALSSQQLGDDINHFIETRLRFLAGKT